MRLLVIRHGESEADLLNVHEGRADFELTKTGHAQAKLLGQWIKDNYSIQKIYCSPLKRASQTASYIAEQCKLELLKEDKLMEFNNGLLAGLDHKTVDEKYPERKDLPLHESVYEQESMLEFRYRAEYILSKIISENSSDDTIAIVTHGGMINQLYRAFLKLPIESEYFWGTGDTGVHEWVIAPNRKFIVRSNSCVHLIS